jgi:hypothetical protein
LVGIGLVFAILFAVALFSEVIKRIFGSETSIGQMQDEGEKVAAIAGILACIDEHPPAMDRGIQCGDRWTSVARMEALREGRVKTHE